MIRCRASLFVVRCRLLVACAECRLSFVVCLLVVVFGFDLCVVVRFLLFAACRSESFVCVV